MSKLNIFTLQHTMNLKQRNRIEWIDIAKAFGIFAIVLGHSSCGLVQQICFSFNSSLFFMLSGLTFCKAKNGNGNRFEFDDRRFKDYFVKIVRSLYIPYLFWSMLSILIYSIMGKVFVWQVGGTQNHFSIIYNLLGMLYANSDTGYFEWNRPLWFIPCLIAVETIWFVILKILNRVKNSITTYLVVMAVFLAWFIISGFMKWNLVLPFELETALCMSFFFGIGLLIRNRIIKVKIPMIAGIIIFGGV